MIFLRVFLEAIDKIECQKGNELLIAIVGTAIGAIIGGIISLITTIKTTKILEDKKFNKRMSHSLLPLYYALIHLSKNIDTCSMESVASTLEKCYDEYNEDYCILKIYRPFKFLDNIEEEITDVARKFVHNGTKSEERTTREKIRISIDKYCKIIEKKLKNGRFTEENKK